MPINAQDQKIISNLPIFNGLNQENLQEFFHHSQLKNYPKGALVFQEGAKALKFYIVLQGWVKLFQINEAGKEFVLQIIGAGEGIMESATLLDSNFTNSAQIVEEARILSIPSLIICQNIKNNQLLANNILMLMAEQSQQLINQLSQLTLKTARQRVGSFLLNLFLRRKLPLDPIRLPYDKALIAAYLKMRSETFSRALQELQESDLIIMEKNLISLPDIFALCNYCDSEINGKCSYYNTENCPNFKQFS
jgi:CRP-like cAMP-binding protein